MEIIIIVKRQKEYDEARTKLLNEYGITVLRFWNEEVIKEVEKVLGEIAAVCNSLSFKLSSSTLPLLQCCKLHSSPLTSSDTPLSSSFSLTRREAVHRQFVWRGASVTLG